MNWPHLAGVDGSAILSVTALAVAVAAFWPSAGASGGPLGTVDEHWRSFAAQRGVRLSAAPVGALLAMLWAVSAIGAGLTWGAVAGVIVALTTLAAALPLGAGIQQIWGSVHERSIARSLPPFLRMWATRLRAGAPPLAALTGVCGGVEGVLGLELCRVVAAARCRATSMEGAFRWRSAALGSPALGDVAATLAAVERTGAPLAALLDTLADEQEARARFREELANAAKPSIVGLAAIDLCVVLLAAATGPILAALVPAGGGLSGLGLTTTVPLGLGWPDWAALAVACLIPWLMVAGALRRDFTE